MIEGETEILSKTLIKPSIPTPHQLKLHKLSLLDQLSPNLHNIFTFFYHQNFKSSNANSVSTFSQRSHLLQISLAHTLSLFYPFAGRFIDDYTILCNDDGVVFFEAKTEIRLFDLLSRPDLDAIGSHFLYATADFKHTTQLQRPMILIGFTLFGCGGTALSMCMTHKFADFASVVTLLQCWTAACRGANPIVVPDLSIAASHIPPRVISGISESVVLSTKKIASRRLVFTASKITELKAKVLSESGAGLKRYPSRADVVTALILKCAMTAFVHKMGKFRPTVLMQAANLRTRMDPPLPENSIGNLAWLFPVIVESESEMEIHELVKKMITLKASLKKRVNKFSNATIVEAVKEGLQEREQLLKNDKHLAVYLCASWCKFPMLELDFGWGRPMWVPCIGKANLMGNTIHLLDTRIAGEVEALVHLEEDEMDMFQHNAELLQYASINPTILTYIPPSL